MGNANPPTTITKFSPSSGLPQSVVKVWVNNFYQFKKNTITIGGATVTIYHWIWKGNASENHAKLFLTVPSNASTGKIKIVTRLGTAESATTFTVT